jgi:hypothetical protein
MTNDQCSMVYHITSTSYSNFKLDRIPISIFSNSVLDRDRRLIGDVLCGYVVGLRTLSLREIAPSRLAEL